MVGEKDPGRQRKPVFLPHPGQRRRQPRLIAFHHLGPRGEHFHGHKEVAVIEERAA